MQITIADHDFEQAVLSSARAHYGAAAGMRQHFKVEAKAVNNARRRENEEGGSVFFNHNGSARRGKS